MKKIVLTLSLVLAPGASGCVMEAADEHDLQSAEPGGDRSDSSDVELDEMTQAVTASDGSWSYKASLPFALDEMPQAYMNGYIYVAGGMTAGTTAPTKTFLRYNVANNSWETLPSLPKALHHLNVVAYNAKLWIISGWSGGIEAPVISRDVWSYDPATKKFTTRAQIPVGVAAAATVVYQQKIYVISGDGDNSFHADGSVGNMQVYDPATNGWDANSMPRIPRPRNHMQGIVIGTKVYVGPGRWKTVWDFSDNHLSVYDFQTRKWAELATKPGFQGTGSTFQAVNGRLYNIGGENGNTVTKEVWRYLPSNNTWTRVNDLLTQVHGTWGTAVGSKIYIAGGGTAGGADSITNKLQVYTLNTGG